MPWWGWVTVGTLLLTAELVWVDFEFYLVFLGVAALIVGLVGLAGVESPYWLQWLAFAALSLISFLIFRKRLYRTLRGFATAEIPENVESERAVALEAIAPGGRGQVDLRGSRWTAQNTGARPIEAGAALRVLRAEGIVLQVRGEEEQE